MSPSIAKRKYFPALFSRSVLHWRILLLYPSFIIYPSLLPAQHPAWQNFSTTDGLPSNAVYYMMQDSRGLLWFSTNQGICHFNGYEFARPVDTSAAAAGSTFQIVEDTRGRIWYMHLDASLSIVENDTVRPWSYNHLSKSFRKNITTYRFAVGKDGAVWIPSWQSGFMIVQPGGGQRIVPALNRNAVLFSEIDGPVVVAGENTQHSAVAAEDAFAQRTGQTSEVLRWQNGKAVSLGRFPVDYQAGEGVKQFRIWRLKNGDFIGFYRQTFYLIRDNRLIWHGQKNIRAETIFEDSDGSILIAVSRGKNRGVLRFRSPEHFQRDAFDNLLPGKSVCMALRDREGGWWASTEDAGIFYCKNPGLELFDTADGLPAAQVFPPHYPRRPHQQCALRPGYYPGRKDLCLL